MNFIYLLIAILGIFILWKIFSFIFKGGNWHLIPTNIARTYKTIRDKFGNKYKKIITRKKERITQNN